MTRVCLPTSGFAGMDEQVCEHFGRARTYTVVDSASGRLDVVGNTTLHMGGQGYPPELLSGVGAEVLLCGGLGRRAVAMLADSGIDVYVGASGTVRDALALWRSGRLQPATVEGACQEHAHRGERGGSGHHHA